MKFLSKDFLLSTETARVLYHSYAKEMPIYDYHCHIDAEDIYKDRRFEDISDVWLSGDHYKWRIMRSNGVSEYYITGDAPPKEKFREFARALPRCIGNPMYHWCHLELKNYFGYEGVLNESTADAVWDITKKRLSEESFSARGLIKKSGVAMIGTTDDPCSDLKYHKLLKEEGFETKVCPSFRPDNAINIGKSGFPDYIKRLSSVCGFPITSVDDVKRALSSRIEYFAECGCRATDHGLDYVMSRTASKEEIEAIFAKAMSGQTPAREECEAYQTELLLYCGREYSRLGLVMQIHFSCMRNPNSRAFAELGGDTGFDCMAVTDSCSALYRYIDALQSTNELPKTIIYSLNPADNEWIDTLIGAFQGEGIAGKLQHGSAWWFNDNKRGMTDQLESLADLGILGNFVGMLTDSRSFLSYARHEYFRRILCDFIGKLVENGEYPDDIESLGTIVEDICANNAKKYFDL